MHAPAAPPAIGPTLDDDDCVDVGEVICGATGVVGVMTAACGEGAGVDVGVSVCVVGDSVLTPAGVGVATGVVGVPTAACGEGAGVIIGVGAGVLSPMALKACDCNS